MMRRGKYVAALVASITCCTLCSCLILIPEEEVVGDRIVLMDQRVGDALENMTDYKQSTLIEDAKQLKHDLKRMQTMVKSGNILAKDVILKIRDRTDTLRIFNTVPDLYIMKQKLNWRQGDLLKLLVLVTQIHDVWLDTVMHIHKHYTTMSPIRQFLSQKTFRGDVFGVNVNDLYS